MKRFQRTIAALAVSAAACLPAYAADISQTQTLTGDHNLIIHALSSPAVGDTFTDTYNFSVAAGSSLSVKVGEWASLADITGISLVNSAGLSLAGTWAPASGYTEWSISASPLAADSYHLLINGSVVNSAAPLGYFGSVVVAAPVPEPETYGMLLAGMGVLGMLARRRRRPE